MKLLRALVLVGFIYGCTLVYDALPSPVRSLMVAVMLLGGSLILHLWVLPGAVEGRSGRESGRDRLVLANARVWRVRWWVRLLAVAVPVVMLPFVLWPHLLNPDWVDGMPADEVVVAAMVYLVLGLAAWAAFRLRLEVDEHSVRVVNPWRSHTAPRAAVEGVRAGGRGLELVLDDGRVLAAFAVQCTGGLGAGEPRWVAVARAITGRDPVR